MTKADAPGAGLPEGLLESLTANLREYPTVDQAVLFGSRAMGTHRANSDIDLCLDAPELPFADYLKLAAMMEEQVAPYGLDLVLRHHVDNPEFLDHIRRVGVVVYRR